MAKLSDLRRPEGAHRDRKRVGRGPGSGLGKTSGRGHKGHKARTGGNTQPWFEGGQMPLQRRVPKRGFHNPFRKVYEIVNLRDLDRLEEETITPEVLASHRLVDLGKGRPVKILGDGRIRRKITVRAHAISAGARAKIEAAGGAVELLET
jgi:large subunit ribosomal protein L15